nr:immunoglobulin light chain junction region [Homo sapiens]
GAQVEDEADYY